MAVTAAEVANPTQAFQRLGARVTLLESEDRLLLRDDQDLAGELLNEFILARRKGLRLHEIGLSIHVYPTLGMAAQRATDDWFSEIAAKPFLKSVISIFRRQSDDFCYCANP